MTTLTNDLELSPCCGAPIVPDVDNEVSETWVCSDCGEPCNHADNECRHARRFDNRGVYTCKDCGATYNENTLEWERQK